MTPETFEVPDDGAQSPETPVEPSAPPVEEPAPEAAPEEQYVMYRTLDGTEKPIPERLAREMAEALGYDNAASVVNQLRNGEETAHNYWQARKYGQAGAQPQYQPQYEPPAPQYAPPARPPQQDDDPVASIQSKLDAVYGFIQREEQRKAAEYYRSQERLVASVDRDYAKFAQELQRDNPDIKPWQVPPRDYLMNQADYLGMFHGEMSPIEMFRAIYNLENAPQMQKQTARRAVQEHVERMSKPTAKVPVPASRPAASPPPPKPGEAINNMPWSDFVRNLPEGKF